MHVIKTSIYLDTSALLPYYRPEALSTQVQTLLQNIQGEVFISDLTEVEVSSALSRWYRMRELDENQAQNIENKFAEHLTQGLFTCLSLDKVHFQQAKLWLNTRQTALRTLDALHLACSNNVGARIITADEALMQAAQYFNIKAQLLSVS